MVLGLQTPKYDLKLDKFVETEDSECSLELMRTTQPKGIHKALIDAFTILTDDMVRILDSDSIFILGNRSLKPWLSLKNTVQGYAHQYTMHVLAMKSMIQEKLLTSVLRPMKKTDARWITMW